MFVMPLLFLIFKLLFLKTVTSDVAQDETEHHLIT